MKIIHAADLFCGAGGTTTGLSMAAEAMGFKLRMIAVNHWQRSIETHAANHPWAEHLCTDLEGLKPSKAVPGGKLDLLVASPECTHHSNARGGKPKCDQSRASAWHVLHWCQELYVRNLIIENVPEFESWGPLDIHKKPMKSRRGHTFQAFVTGLKSLGYTVDYQVLNCANYGDATTRRRFFLLASRGNKRIRWPELAHAENPSADIFGAKSQSWRPARDIIDWSIPGHSIFLKPEDVRKHKLRINRPLAENTMRRIEAGIKRYWGSWAEPFLVLLRGTDSGHLGAASSRSVESPIPTLTAGGEHVGLCQPFFVHYYGNHAGKIDSERRLRDIESPIPAQTTENRFGLVQPLILPQCTPGMIRPVTDGLPTITATGAHGLIEPFIVKYFGNGGAVSIGDPLDTITTNDRFGLVRPMLIRIGGEEYLLDILFRMLTPAELARAHSFPAGYTFAGNKSEVVKQIGNSVPVLTARALCETRLAA